MATRKSKPADQLGGTNSKARALVDLPAHGVLSGGLLVADEQTIADLAAIAPSICTPMPSPTRARWKPDHAHPHRRYLRCRKR